MLSARERTIIARTKHYLEDSYSMKVDIEVWERLMEPENREISLRYFLKKALFGASGREGDLARKLAKRVA